MAPKGRSITPGEAFAEAFRALFKEKGWTQETWAAATGTTQANISRLLNGRSTESFRLQLCESLGLDYIDFLKMGRDLLTVESGADATPYAALTSVINDFRSWAAGRLGEGMPGVHQIADELQIIKIRFSITASNKSKNKPRPMG